MEEAAKNFSDPSGDDEIKKLLQSQKSPLENLKEILSRVEEEDSSRGEEGAQPKQAKPAADLAETSSLPPAVSTTKNTDRFRNKEDFLSHAAVARLDKILQAWKVKKASETNN